MGESGVSVQRNQIVVIEKLNSWETGFEVSAVGDWITSEDTLKFNSRFRVLSDISSEIWHVNSGIRFTSNVEIAVQVFRESLEELRECCE